MKIVTVSTFNGLILAIQRADGTRLDIGKVIASGKDAKVAARNLISEVSSNESLTGNRTRRWLASELRAMGLLY